MTEEQIKEMLNGIINNGEKWECRPIIRANNAFDLEEKQNRYNFKYEPYKLGDEIHADWEYRKVETWLEENYGDKDWVTDDIDANEIRVDAIEEVCKKILEEVDKGNNLCSASYYLKQIIKDLGIEL